MCNVECDRQVARPCTKVVRPCLVFYFFNCLNIRQAWPCAIYARSCTTFMPNFNSLMYNNVIIYIPQLVLEKYFMDYYIDNYILSIKLITLRLNVLGHSYIKLGVAFVNNLRWDGGELGAVILHLHFA